MFGGARDRRRDLGDIREEEEPDPRDMYRFRTTAYHQQQTQGGTPQRNANANGNADTPPRQESGNSADRTPPAQDKVLPWVASVEEGTIPEGMFGPYDSLPPSRMPTMHESQTRQPHPFAFTGEEDVPPAVPSKDGSARKPSPKKAATQLTGSPRHHHASPTRSAPHPLPASHSPLSHVPAPRSRAGVSRKPVPSAEPAHVALAPTKEIPAHSAQPVPAMTTGGKGDHDHPFSHTDAARAQTEAMEVARAQALAQLQHADAQGIGMGVEGQGQGVAIGMGDIPADLARAMGSLGMQPTPQGQVRARGTFETGTSGPSFGHLYHDGAQPTSTRASAQQRQQQQQQAHAAVHAAGEHDGPASHAMTRDLAADAQAPGSFVRVPFGVPLNMQLPRPMMLMRTGTGMGMGIGISPLGMGMGMGMGLTSPGMDVMHGMYAPEEELRRDDRSAYVETVEDEDSPTARTHAKSKTHRTTVPPTAAARTDKTNDQMAHQSAKSTQGGLPKGFDPEMYPPPAVSHRPKDAHAKSKAASKTHRSSAGGTPPLDVRSKNGRTSHPPVSAAHKSNKSHKAPSEQSALGATLDLLEAQQHGRRSLGVRCNAPSTQDGDMDGASIASDARTGDHRSSADPDRTYRAHPPPSAAPTTASNIRRLVSNSGVHDEQLCQLLDAAKLNLIGAEAKKALQRAARARVIELRDARETQEQMQAALDVSDKGQSVRSKDTAKERSIQAASVTTAPAASIKTDTEAAVPAPQAPSVSASRHPAKSQANTVRQGEVDGRTDVSPKTKVKRAPTVQTAGSRAASAAPQQSAMQDMAALQMQMMQMMQGGNADPYRTPRWAKDLRDKMSLLDERMNEMQRQADHRQTYDSAITPSGEGVSPGLLQELMFGGFAGPQMSYFALPGMPTGMSAQGAHIEPHARNSPHSTKIREVPPSTKARAQSGADATLTWGSEVELPSGTGSPTKPTQGPPSTFIPRGPIINVHPPTESNARTRAASIPSRTDPRTPAAHTMPLQQDEPGTGMTGMAEVDKRLPDTPEAEKASLQYDAGAGAGAGGEGGARLETSSPPSVEQMRGRAQSIAHTYQSGYGGYPYEQASTAQAPEMMPRVYETTVRDGTMQDSATTDTLPTPTGRYDAVLGAPITVPSVQPPCTAQAPSRTAIPMQQPYTPITEQQSAINADAVTAQTHFTRPSRPPHPQVPAAQSPFRGDPTSTAAAARSPAGKARDIIRVREVTDDTTSRDSLEPWDAITQKLYQWAMVWEEDSFQKALEGLALGKQAEGLALTVFMMMVYKRLVAHHMTASPPQVCDKLFVPPIMAEAINQAVHNKQFDSAGAMLEELWYPYGMKTPPRVIIALAKHRKETDKWTAHRFDLSSGNLTSYAVTSDEQNLPDGRPIMWWYAIRSAWTEYNIPDPESLKQRVEYVRTEVDKSGDNSLKAMNYARNLLLGFRPELGRDLTKLRETVWNEVKRLSNKKKAGHLVIDAEHRHHARM